MYVSNIKFWQFLTKKNKLLSAVRPAILFQNALQQKFINHSQLKIWIRISLLWSKSMQTIYKVLLIIYNKHLSDEKTFKG